jgi:hypothetical protein
VCILITAVVLTTLGVLALLVLVLVGIRAEERRMSLTSTPAPALKRQPAGCSASASAPPALVLATTGFLLRAICHDRLDPARHRPRHQDHPRSRRS